MRDLNGKVAFITGGASGVGFGMAKAFAEAGMKVVIADIRRDFLDEAIERLPGRTVHAIRLDVTDREAFAAAADEAERVYGPVDLLCNNAGVNLFAPIEAYTYDDWDWVLGVNLGGVINGVRTFVPRMKARGQGGHILNTGSMASWLSGPGAGIYTTSKFAIRGLSECLRWSLAADGIGVSLLSPGLVKSRIYESERTRPPNLSTETAPVDDHIMAQLPEWHQLGMEPEEVGRIALQGVLDNELYIFSHAEFKEELAEVFTAVLAAMPGGEVDAPRMSVEEARRRVYADARRKADRDH